MKGKKIFNRLNKVVMIIFIIIIILFSSILVYRVVNFLDTLIVKEIVIKGASKEVANNIKEELSNLQYKRIKDIKLQEIDDVITNMPWIYRASVHRNFNGRLTIYVFERNPYFIWLDDNNNYQVIGADNKIINKKLKFSLDRLITIEKGMETLEKADEIKFIIYKDEDILRRIKRIEFKKYRWDISLVDGKIIKLPDSNITRAYQKVIEANNKYKLLERDLEYIDATGINVVLVKYKDKK